MKNPRNFLVYHGHPGIGKTFFCMACVEWALSTFDFVRFHSERELLSCLREAQNEFNDWAKVLIQKIDDDFVMLDDVGSWLSESQTSQKDKSWPIDVFFNFLDYRYDHRKPTLITSNLTREDFAEKFSERIASRLFASENTIISRFDVDDVDLRTKGY